ncbi:MAG: hypothetical protein ABSF98_00095 [Bryobacteraceae bacterium]|jgi:hypothetical protein
MTRTISLLSIVLFVGSAAAAINEYPCAGGTTSYVARTGLTSCKVSRETAFGEARVPEGSTISLREDKPAFTFLSRDARIDGYTCRGGEHDWSTAFYPSGKLKVCWLAADQDVQGVPCMRASFFSDVFGGTAGVHFYENGKLRTCKVSRDTSIQGRRFRSRDHVLLSADGTVLQK